MCSGIEGLAGDPIQVLSMISDNHFVMEVKKDYEPSMVTAFIRLNGVTVGCVANRTERYEDGKRQMSLRLLYPARAVTRQWS